MKYFVGADCGGTKSEILIGDETGKLTGKYIGAGYLEFATDLHAKLQTGSIDAEKFNSEFISKYLEQTIKHLDDALAQSNLGLSDVHALFASMAAINGGDMQMNFEKDLRGKMSNQNVSVRNDMYGAWRAGTDKYPSGVIAIGTGTNIMFFDENGSSTSVEGKIKYQAARALGFRAFMHACYSAIDLLEPTILTEHICEFAKTETLEEAFAKTNYGSDINSLPYHQFVPYVYGAAEKNDRVAEDFVNQTGRGFAECICAGIEDLGWKDKEIPLVLNGGAFKGKGYVMEKAIKDCLVGCPNLILFQAEHEPVYGALMLAYESYNYGTAIQATDEEIAKFGLKRKIGQ